METIIELKEDKKDYTLDQIKYLNEQLRQRNYAMIENTINLSNEMYKIRNISRDQVRKAMTDPYKNVELLQKVSLLLKETSGTYKRILNMISTMNTFDHYIIPINISKFKDKNDYVNSFFKSAALLKKYQLKHICPWITEKVLEQGEIYLYKIEDSKCIMMQQIPASYCTITSKVNGVLRYGIDLRKINKKTLSAFPVEVQEAYKKLNDGRLKKEDLIENKYYELSDNAVAFNIDIDSTKGIPFFSFLFDDILELEDMKDLKGSNAIIESIKLIHGKVPYGKNDEPLVAFDLLSAYYHDIKSNLPAGTSVAVTPLDMEGINLSDGTSKINDYVKEAKEFIFDNAGINTALFNSDKINTESIADGVIADSLIPMRIQNEIETWINYELNKKNSSKAFQLYFVGTTHFNQSKISQQLRENINSVGDSRTVYLASTGKEPIEIANLYKAEQLMEIDDLLPVKQASYTFSNNDVGRPTNEDKGDGGTNGNKADRKDENK
ncbi:hypothetical protein C4071_00370 [Clostridioides difficile]|uniref:hypothetical protein n=1 Tax=Clostridioides difficile TaxID=1496 RepID=UPI000E11F9D0|nr:hypothetical protein [Clostridioides difficile]EGT4117281.1 hypothetical protein [Clostridioides difficile]MCJ0133607.1 hypothetical protein [Clostridioides difficile]MCJ0174287.1 hypothetical protein [Clostridioides difficile]MDB0345864.1 hypothetical protein [Clostridioides difficile]MDB0465131.1 hypothetical protein [Clostridioides difficile]